MVEGKPLSFLEESFFQLHFCFGNYLWRDFTFTQGNKIPPEVFSLVTRNRGIYSQLDSSTYLCAAVSHEAGAADLCLPRT